MPRIKVLSPMIIGRKHQKAGSEHEVSKSLANLLIQAGRAAAVRVPAPVPVAPPPFVDHEEEIEPEGTEAPNKKGGK